MERDRTVQSPVTPVEIREMVPRLRERRRVTDDGRRLPDETVQELRESGIAALLTPPSLGGPGLGCDALFEAGLELAAGCGSTAWVAGVYAVHSHLITTFPVEAQREVFANGPGPFVATAFSPMRAATRREGDGAVVSGQWDFSSGIDFADWVVVVAMTETGPLAHLVPTDDVEIVDTWFTSGLRGSGSKDVVINDLYVPPHRLLPIAEVAGPAGFTTAYGLYGLPFARVPLSLSFGTGVIATTLGTARAAVDVFTEQTAEKIGGLSGVKGRDRSDIQARLGKSIGDVEAAISVVRDCYVQIRAIGEADRDVTERELVAFRARFGWATRVAHQGVERLYEVGGANALRTDDLFGQFYRDHTASSHHYAIQADTYETARGRVALGLEHGVVGL